MDTSEIEELLEKLRETYGHYKLCIILEGKNVERRNGLDFTKTNRKRLQKSIIDQLPSRGRAKIKKISKKSHKLMKTMGDKIEDRELSKRFQEFIEETAEEHMLAGFRYFLDELKMKQ